MHDIAKHAHAVYIDSIARFTSFNSQWAILIFSVPLHLLSHSLVPLCSHTHSNAIHSRGSMCIGCICTTPHPPYRPPPFSP